ncbi:MAG: hypothetical protein JW860_16355, partial [Sedimentisphaerales bacterium]|nr:hypothetical protein [Sedimentisphaerales bacterium]
MLKSVEKSLCLVLCISVLSFPCIAWGYDNFKVSVYCRAQEVSHMAEPDWLQRRWEIISQQVNIDKVYLETHRDVILVDKETLEFAREFFQSRGIEVAGGITYTIMESNRFKTFCYTNPEHRARVQEIAEHTAGEFDEVILDDFFFTNCKCDLCIQAKGARSWSRYRLDLMAEAAQNLVVGPAKAVNPKVKMVIKYPNWYDH